MRRLIAAILAIPTLFNGLPGLAAVPLWYETVPGVSETGPFNPHFVQDIGIAFLVAGLALAARAWRPRYRPAAVAGAGSTAAPAPLPPRGQGARDTGRPPLRVPASWPRTP